MNPCNALLAFLTAVFVILTSANHAFVSLTKFDTALAERHGERLDMIAARHPNRVPR